MQKKPAKPRPDFPLFAHHNGQWSKKICGRFRYFGVWADPQAALEKYQKERDYLYTGQQPPADTYKVSDLLDAFLGRKYRAHQSGEISGETYSEYENTCDVIAAWGKHRAIKSLTFGDLDKLRAALGQGKTKKLGVVTLKRRLTIARMVFKHASKLGESVDYADALATPSAKLLRRIENERDERLFTAEQVRQVVKNANGEMKAMVLLGINCGFYPGDCCALPTNRVDLKNGWHTFPRTKTEMKRRCPLWPETVAALKKATNNGKVFDANWNRHKIADEFRKIVDSFYVKDVTVFKHLRHTFETIATTADVSQAVIDSIMGWTQQDMASIYRQKVFDPQLETCTNHVRLWYLGKVNLDTL